ncbi:TadE/TadG family type IV pilus assembly protein [bacterium RCC_150]
MWRLKRKVRKQDREKGAAGVIVAVMMLVLIGVGAMSVDVGQIYAERAQLQNGADAGALAVAQLCSNSGGCTQGAANTAAKSLADSNSNDGVSNVQSVDLSVANQVTVTTSTIDGTSHAGFLTQLFASALNASPVTVGAKATASLKPPSGGGAFPLAFSNKCWDLSGGTATGALQKISWKPGTTCTNPSGLVVPGGWGWLSDPDGDCYAITSTGNMAGTDPGNNPPNQCATILQGWINSLSGGTAVKVTFPVFDTTSGTGNNAVFHVIGYATLNIVGWKVGNGTPYEYHNTTSALGNSNLACSGGSDRCVVGQFVKFATVDDFDGNGTGPSQDFGTWQVQLIK